MAISRIQIPGELTDLIPVFGLVGPVTEWFLGDTVIPVALVNSQVSLTAQSTPVLMTVTQSAGELASPAANTRHVNTGPLDSGDYLFQVEIGTEADETYRIRLRDASDAADIWSMIFVANTSGRRQAFEIAWSLSQNERLVVENTSAIVGLSQARVWYTPI